MFSSSPSTAAFSSLIQTPVKKLFSLRPLLPSQVQFIRDGHSSCISGTELGSKDTVEPSQSSEFLKRMNLSCFQPSTQHSISPLGSSSKYPLDQVTYPTITEECLKHQSICSRVRLGFKYPAAGTRLHILWELRPDQSSWLCVLRGLLAAGCHCLPHLE